MRMNHLNIKLYSSIWKQNRVFKFLISFLKNKPSLPGNCIFLCNVRNHGSLMPIQTSVIWIS